MNSYYEKQLLIAMTDPGYVKWDEVKNRNGMEEGGVLSPSLCSVKGT